MGKGHQRASSEHPEGSEAGKVADGNRHKNNIPLWCNTVPFGTASWKTLHGSFSLSRGCDSTCKWISQPGLLGGGAVNAPSSHVRK